MTAIKAVIYARYSSHNQREESIEGQLRECHEYAKKNNFIIVDEYCDRALSGKTDHRPMFQKLIRDSEKGKFEAVIMYTLVSSVYVYDDGDKGRKIVLTFNISGSNTFTISSSDIEGIAPLNQAYPNSLFFVKHCFGYVFVIEED